MMSVESSISDQMGQGWCRPYRHAWFKSLCGGVAEAPSNPVWVGIPDECDDCWGSLEYTRSQAYCRICGLVHWDQLFWEVSTDIEARRRQFDHNSEDGSGTLQNKHDTVVENSAADTTFDGSELDYYVYPLHQYNAGRDPHSVQGGNAYKLDRDRRFLEQRAEACADTVGLTGQQIDEVIRLVTSINSGAFTSYGPERNGGGQAAHIIAAIAHVGDTQLSDDPKFVEFDDRMQERDEFQKLAAQFGMDRNDVRGAVSQLRKQLRG